MIRLIVLERRATPDGETVPAARTFLIEHAEMEACLRQTGYVIAGVIGAEVLPAEPFTSGGAR